MENVKVPLKYLGEIVEIEVPRNRLKAYVKPRSIPPVRDPASSIRRILRTPIGSPPLRSLVKPRSRIVVLVDDYTRPTPVSTVLPIVLEELRLAGARREDITILVALGTHRPMTRDELKAKLGSRIVEEYEVVNHRWRDESELETVGYVDGNPIKVNKLAFKSDLLVAIGNIVPHRITGYGGGAKIIQPGICGAETTEYTHWMAVKTPPEDILGVPDNPVRRVIEEIGRRVRLKFIVNTILNPDRTLASVVAGDPVEAHRAGVEEARRICEVKLKGRVDVAICDSYPAEVDLWQAVKALYVADIATKPGGVIVHLAPCPEGIAPEHPDVASTGFKPLEEAERLVEEGVISRSAGFLIGCIGEMLKSKRCIIVSDGISEDEARRVGLDYRPTVEEAIREALKAKKHGSIAVFTHTPELALKIV